MTEMSTASASHDPSRDTSDCAEAALPCQSVSGVDLKALAQQLFIGERSHLAQSLKIDAEATDGIDCHEFLERSTLQRVLERYCRETYPGDDEPSAISLWSQWYFGILLPPLLLLSESGRCRVPAKPEALRMTWAKACCPASFMLTVERAALVAPEDSVWDRYAPIVEDHIAPLISALVDLSRLSPKVFWMNAAVVIDYMAGAIATERQTDLRILTTERTTLSGSRNPLYSPYSQRQKTGESRCRRVCCLRYKLSSVERCPNCPVKG